MAYNKFRNSLQVELIEIITGDVSLFIGTTEQHDDMTMIAVQVSE
jgi:serine phosphatase RsbU (regulator of sigma subunit)